MGEPAAGAAAARRRFLTFRVAETLYALPAEEVVEVIRAPAVAHAPLGPRALLGLANLRGAVIAVASARALLDRPEGVAERALVLDGPDRIALAVDRVESLVSVDVDRIESPRADLAGPHAARLRGAFASAPGAQAARILDIRPMLESALAPGARPARALAPATGTPEAQTLPPAATERLVVFGVGAQRFALPLEAVQEIIPTPAGVIGAPGAEAVLLGIAAHRERLLPLLSLHELLRVPGGSDLGASAKVLVTQVAGAMVGLVADTVRAVIAVDPARLEPAPAMLAARSGGESAIRSIYRGADDALVCILAMDRLFREDVMARLGAGPATGAAAHAPEAAASRRLLVFRLGEAEFALPIEVVDEVARAPERITRTPRSPAFLEGVINLRGEVLPVVDQRRRFDMPPSPNPEARRLVVVRAGRLRAGLIVDSVSEVMEAPLEAMAPPPPMSGPTARLVTGVVNLPAAGRLVMLLDPAEVLTPAESGALEASDIGDGGAAAGEGAPAS